MTNGGGKHDNSEIVREKESEEKKPVTSNLTEQPDQNNGEQSQQA